MLKLLINKLGIDQAIFYTISARALASVFGIVTVMLIATHLTGIEQGFYYTFGSILAAQLFFELGLTGIISQFVAHEKAFLEEKNGILTGDCKYISRLSDLLRFCIRWYLIVSLVLLFGLSFGGLVYFNYFYINTVSVTWQTPWVLLVAGTCLNFILSPICAFLEGLGKVKEIAKIRFFQQLVAPILVWLGLLIGFKLYVAAIAPVISAIFLLAFGSRKFTTLLTFIYKFKITDRVNYMQEIFPYQWRIAISWISGYFIFQFFNPVLFATEGAVVAGQMGMTLTILTAIQSISLSWITTKVPLMSSLIATNQFETLDKVFNTTLRQMLVLVSLILVAFVLVVVVLDKTQLTINNIIVADRLLPVLPLSFMAISLFINQYVAAIATYLRCHKKEPFLYNSIVAGVLCAALTIYLGKHYGLLGVTGGYLSITILLLPWSYYIYKSKRRLWHY